MTCVPTLLLAQVPATPTGSAQTFVWVGPRDFPTVNFDRLNQGDPVPGMPGKVFKHTLLATGGGGWYLADAERVSQVLTSNPDDAELPPPPTQDQWEYTEAYSGIGTRVPVLIRTANPARWFCKGCKYVAPYSDFRMTILDHVQLSDGNWAWIGQITQSGGTPPRGTILSYPLYGDRGLWLTEDEFNGLVSSNSGR